MEWLKKIEKAKGNSDVSYYNYNLLLKLARQTDTCMKHAWIAKATSVLIYLFVKRYIFMYMVFNLALEQLQ